MFELQQQVPSRLHTQLLQTSNKLVCVWARGHLQFGVPEVEGVAMVEGRVVGTVGGGQWPAQSALQRAVPVCEKRGGGKLRGWGVATAVRTDLHSWGARVRTRLCAWGRLQIDAQARLRGGNGI